MLSWSAIPGRGSGRRQHVRADATGVQGLKQRCAVQHKTRTLAGLPLHIRVRMRATQARVDGRESVNLLEQRA